jgi:acetamidase/formamidase
MTLSVRVDEVVPASWGTCLADGTEHFWELDTEAMTGRNQYGHTVALRPFLGVLGMPPPDPGRHSTTPPRVWGGNLDCRELVAGSTLFLPVPVAGALFSAGDGHAAQGDGEVSGTAIECPMDRVVLTLDLRDDLDLTAPVARTPAGWLTFGLGTSLDAAATMARDSMVGLISRRFGIARRDALALASVAVDLRVTQIVNETVGVHAVLAPGAIR